MQPKRKPERWDGLDPWEALATAIVLQAHQDLVKGARMARIILNSDDGHRRQRAIRAFRAFDAHSAAMFFLDHPLWHHFLANFRHRHTPQKILADVGDVLAAYNELEGYEMDKEEKTVERHVGEAPTGVA